MSYYECENGEHLVPLPRIEAGNDDSSSSHDSEVEIVSTYDADEYELVQLSTYLRVDSCTDNESEKENEPSSCQLVSYSHSDDSIDDSHPIRTRLSHPTTLADYPTESVRSSSVKLKRRQWTVREKLKAISTFEKNDNKYQTCKKHGCTPSQLRKWLGVKDRLESMKRRRVEGGGIKSKYKELDSRLFAWFQELRSPPTDSSNSSVPPENIRREKITFRRLQRQGEMISDELNHDRPSSKWYRRFMKRYRLSLQRPKRQQKIPIDEAHRLAHSFYTFIRRSSTWASSRGPMGCFTPKDVYNFDESSLALFGDQTKRSINYVNTCNKISENILSKRFATVLLIVSAEDNHRLNPTLLFKGQGLISSFERQQYAKGVNALFTAKAVINKSSMDQFIHTWHEQVKDGFPKLMISDSATPHLNEDTVRRPKEKSVVMAIVPGGTTMYLQVVDVSVFSVFKQHYYDVAEEWLEANGPRNKVKLSSAQSRVLCTSLTKSAWLRTVASFDFKKAFLDIGYIWYDGAPIRPRALTGFCFDPLNPDTCSVTETNDNNDDKIEREANIARKEIRKQINSDGRMKQANLKQFWQ